MSKVWYSFNIKELSSKVQSMIDSLNFAQVQSIIEQFGNVFSEENEEVANQYLKDIRQSENKSVDELINIDEYDINKTSNKFSTIFKNSFLKYAKNNEFLEVICDDNFTIHKLRHAYTDYCVKTLKPENITDEAFAAEILGHEYAPSASTVYKQALENENKALENENQALKAEIEELKKSIK